MLHLCPCAAALDTDGKSPKLVITEGPVLGEGAFSRVIQVLACSSEAKSCNLKWKTWKTLIKSFGWVETLAYFPVITAWNT